jgi:hypothetical protein
MNKQVIWIALLALITMELHSQEFFCSIQVNAQQVEGTDRRVYENMETSLSEFINSRRWTSLDIKPAERIECTFVITISNRPSTDRFVANLSLVASRPIYKTAYNSTLINYIDRKFEFNYVEFQPLEFQENTYESNLTSTIAFYLYIILGLDFDSYSLYGGSPFFEKAEAIVNAAQNSAESGWRAFEDQRNRYWMLENYLNNSYSDLRKFNYEYHRLGLDVMSEKVDEGRSAIANSINLLRNVHRERPGLFALTLMVDAKRDEIINIFSKGNPREQNDVEQIMKEVDPANASNYSKISRRN